MPWLEGALPFQSSGGPQSAHASRAGADDAAPRALSQTVRYLSALKARPHGLTDLEAEDVLGIDKSSVTARRRPLVKAGLVQAAGHRPGPTGVPNTIWKAL